MMDQSSITRICRVDLMMPVTWSPGLLGQTELQSHYHKLAPKIEIFGDICGMSCIEGFLNISACFQSSSIKLERNLGLKDTSEGLIHIDIPLNKSGS
ncbi:hypothetical protein Y1Q_0013487 [Alligator mississippiensis]|uniref:Uncharacterized protein n=1 Tax=Alligator mississippiensis TaxID=8496 RepID=A0A151P2X1_ALLMI|nr:hypothetical protein Y1Q_0013487 [Alligator mississippiensis]